MKFLSLILFFAMHVVFAEDQWKIDERDVLQTAAVENLPIVAVFYKAEECPWSHKFVHDVLQSQTFVGKVGVDAILWEIILGQEKEDLDILEKYHVVQSPQILLLDPQGKEFARLDYSPISADLYAQQILQLIDDFQQVCLSLQDPKKDIQENQCKELYLKAKQFSAPCFKQVLLEKGLKKEKGTFFHIEKYALMLDKYKLKNPDVVKMKKRVLSRDPDNALQTHFKIAVLDFQKRASSLKVKDRCEKALIPLLNYMHRFREKDKENMWRIELMIAEFLFAKNILPAALTHAEESLKTVPLSDKPRVLQAISAIQQKGMHD